MVAVLTLLSYNQNLVEFYFGSVRLILIISFQTILIKEDFYQIIQLLEIICIPSPQSSLNIYYVSIKLKTCL
jgi:hypothetical protein